VTSDDVVRAVGHALSDAHYFTDNGRDCVTGKAGSREVRVRCYWGSVHSWNVQTKVEHAPPLLLEARKRQLAEEPLIKRGAVRVLALGDESFDKTHLVEAAPEATAREIMDADVRRAVVAAEGRVTTTIDRGVVAAGDNGQTYSSDTVLQGLALVGLFADRLEAIGAKRRVAPVSKEQRRREREDVEDLRRLRSRNFSRMTLPQLLLIVCLLGGFSALFVWACTR